MKKYKWLIVDFLTISFIISITTIFVALGKWDWKWCSIFFIISYFLNSIFVIFSLANNDNPREKLSWIFFMICIPCIGLIFYSLFRIRKQVGISIEEFNNEFDEFRINKFVDEQNQKINHIARWESSLVKKNLYETNLKIFNHGYEAYDQLLKDIKKSKKYIHIEMYILKISEIYEKLKHLLIKKAKEGIEVRIIFDRFGSWKVPIDEFKTLKKHGIKLCFFNVPIYPYVRNTDNRRLHRKFFIIDGEIIHFGGLNISDEYCSFSTKYGYWADSNFSMTGKVINDYESIFLYDWFKITKEKLNKNQYKNNINETKTNASILNFQEGPILNTSYLEDSLNYWINNSTKIIRIATPYFIPTDSILNSLKNALTRGVQIEIYIPGKPDKKFTYKATLFYSNKLIKYGAKIFSYDNTFLHSKFAIFDDFAYVGTNNLDMRSLYTNHESINLLFGKEVIKHLNKIFDTYAQFSTIKTYEKTCFKKLIKTFLFKLTSPLM